MSIKRKEYWKKRIDFEKEFYNYLYLCGDIRWYQIRKITKKIETYKEWKKYMIDLVNSQDVEIEELNKYVNYKKRICNCSVQSVLCFVMPFFVLILGEMGQDYLCAIKSTLQSAYNSVVALISCGGIVSGIIFSIIWFIILMIVPLFFSYALYRIMRLLMNEQQWMAFYQDIQDIVDEMIKI